MDKCYPGYGFSGVSRNLALCTIYRGGILLYVRVLRKNLSLEESLLGEIVIWVRVLCRNLTYETSSLEECYSMYDLPGGILLYVRVL